MLSIFVTGWSLICVLSLFLLFLSGYFFDSPCFSLWGDCGGNGWIQPLYYIAELCLSYYSIDKHYCNEISRLLLLSLLRPRSRSHIVRVPIAHCNRDCCEIAWLKGKIVCPKTPFFFHHLLWEGSTNIPHAFNSHNEQCVLYHTNRFPNMRYQWYPHLNIRIQEVCDVVNNW